MKKLGILGFLILIFGVLTIAQTDESKQYQSYQSLHPDNFFDSRYFSKEPHKVGEAPSSKIYGAVLPHHLIAYKLIDQVFNLLESQKPPLIILIGPNHFNQGERISTSTWGWQTPFGIVETDRETIDTLAKNALVKISDDIFTSEHSMGNLMPFIKYYLPEAKVVPIIFHHDLSKAEANFLSTELAHLAQEKDAVIMASIDFSHYLTNKEAQLKDQETLEIIRTKNIPRLLSLGDAHLDSPGSMVTMLLTMEKLGIEDFEVLQHTNSGILIGNDLIETTSYFTMIFR
ncbi:MAG: AmmeMemoRadiSam system protein B [Peptococcales bacterium]|jgi:AmmeMemoRadiSam system protein B